MASIARYVAPYVPSLSLSLSLSLFLAFDSVFILFAFSSEAAVTVDVHAGRGLVDAGHKYLDVRCVHPTTSALSSMPDLSRMRASCLFLKLISVIVNLLSPEGMSKWSSVYHSNRGASQICKKLSSWFCKLDKID
ncbi:hypothetical protein GW17_00057689 [Ensete ventricosum]|nr:hypothetical protein GW17_00057689 [Ensete ventricosum]